MSIKNGENLTIDVTAVSDRLLPTPEQASEGDSLLFKNGQWVAQQAGLLQALGLGGMGTTAQTFPAVSPGATLLEPANFGLEQSLPAGQFQQIVPGKLRVVNALSGNIIIRVNVSMRVNDNRTCELYLTADGAEIGSRNTRFFEANDSGALSWVVPVTSLAAGTDLGLECDTTDSSTGRTYTLQLFQIEVMAF